MEKAYKFRIYPNAEQEAKIRKTLGCSRYVYNHFLARRVAVYEESAETLGYVACCAELTKLKQELDWLYEADNTALQSSLRDLDNAYKNFFRRIKSGGGNPGYPRFKSKKDNRQSYRAVNNGNTVAVLDCHVKLPKLGLVKAAISKQIQGRVLNATVSRNPSGKYFVSICCTDVDIKPLKRTGKDVGLDAGIRNLISQSDGIQLPNQRYFKQSENKLARAQRSMSRKTIGSKNRNRARIKVARLHEKIANQRKDYLHKITTELVRDYDIISAETLDITAMAQTGYLAKMIYDASWGELQRQLSYKCEWYGKQFVKIGSAYPSSNICSECGYLLDEHIKLSKRKWVCPQCGAAHDRDLNAAKNIHVEGKRLLTA